jgi:hypothetical protein
MNHMAELVRQATQQATVAMESQFREMLTRQQEQHRHALAAAESQAREFKALLESQLQTDKPDSRIRTAGVAQVEPQAVRAAAVEAVQLAGVAAAATKASTEDEEFELLERRRKILEGEEMRAIWRDVDRNHNGSLDLSEMTVVFDHLGLIYTDEEAEGAFRSIDTDGSGEVEYEEFALWYLDQMEERRQRLTKSKRALLAEVVDSDVVLTTSPTLRPGEEDISSPEQELRQEATQDQKFAAEQRALGLASSSSDSGGEEQPELQFLSSPAPVLPSESEEEDFSEESSKILATEAAKKAKMEAKRKKAAAMLRPEADSGDASAAEPVVETEVRSIAGTTWVEYTDDTGTPYFYNTATKETVWDRPK